MKEKIKLAHAHVNQISKDGEKGEWKIEANITNEHLGELPKHLDHHQVFSILNMARKYELEAFNVGINFGKEQYKLVYDQTLAEMQQKLEMAKHENERIAEALELITNNK